jgi:F0F1-type ATP synthase epsilon subunit
LQSLLDAGLIEHQRHETTVYVRLAERQESLDLEQARRSA